MEMPIGVKGSVERLRASNDIMNTLKNSPIVALQNNFEALVGKVLPWNVSPPSVSYVLLSNVAIHHYTVNPPLYLPRFPETVNKASGL